MTTFPQINLNGTSGESLCDQLRNAVEKVQDAVKAICDAAPHGRDYQTLPAGTYEKARKEFETRLKKIEEVEKELKEIWENVYFQQEDRRK